ncbi:branched-chain amino acid transport system ATP-binding protein [Desulfatibacillum alkenivorans DSM 16219]|jgi:branched-chain amino acid transport system ATP-binding protein|uniref:Branched-chain amino acid transport system ATP-binding protein n=1 Tax=Desulfatibacillum alkenivorans DSM 16219 TaxID=1121393 RepID=A0A1M6I4A4_9BACT|nr:ABC transporter ATP-binding protein [Desulfatibacillum alkenivorans]SHJ29245.1 branched-chain amino acid transport system ATP-binding protein [Desulfatibacillum alkenivorans DSM 16219]
MSDNGFFRAAGISIQFGGIKALENVSLDVKQGEVHAIIGPNGAGKTTLLNCISRQYKADSGQVFFQGKNILKLKPHQVVSRGIARTFQNIELFKNMTVMDNMLLGRHSQRATGIFSDILFYGKARQQESDFRLKVEEVIDFLDLQAYRNRIINDVPYGVQKNVELGRALVMEPRLLLLDEPSSGLNMEETQDLAFWIEDIRDDLGITIILVEHDMRLVMDSCDRVTALDYGGVLAVGEPKEVVKNPDVVKAYLGE